MVDRLTTREPRGAGRRQANPEDPMTERSPLTTADRMRFARHAAGAWKDFPESGAEYVERIRGSRRLSLTTGRS